MTPRSARDTFEGVIALLIFAAVLFAVIALSGCAGLSQAPGPGLQRGVYAMENDFAAALKVAVAYESLPACSASQKMPCNDPKVDAKIKLGATVARASLATAEAAVRSNSNASAMTAAALQARADISAFAALVEEFAK